MMSKKAPIGFYIKQVDQLLTEKINLVQAAFGLTRTSWQILNAIHEQENLEKEALLKLMSQLSDTKTIDDILTKFQTDNIVHVENNSLLSLTRKGKILFEDCFEQQNEFRKKAMQNVTEQDYQTTISTLEQIIRNIQ